MRVLDVHTTGDHAVDVVLHPRLTVLSGIEMECSILADGLAQAFVLAGHDITGTVEYSGFHMPLDQTAVVSLDLPGSGFRVISATDLPHPDQATRGQAATDLGERRRGWEERRAEASTRSVDLQRRFDATGAAVEVGRQELDGASAAAADLVAQSEAAADQPERLAAEIESARAATLVVNDRSRLVAELAPKVGEAFDSRGESIRSLRNGTEPAEHRELLQQAIAAELLDPKWCDDISSWLDSVGSGRATPDPTLAVMMQEVDLLERRWAELSALGVEDEAQVVDARGRLDALVARLDALEGLARDGILVDQARTEIDTAHTERTRFEEERHLRSGGLTEAIAHEEEIVGLYGFDSYLDYTIALSTRSVGEAVNATLERVRAERVGASDALEAVRGEAAAVRTSLSDERAELRDRIRSQTGVALDALTVEVLERVPELPGSLGGIAVAMQTAVTAADSGCVAQAAELETLEARQVSMVDPIPALLEQARAQQGRAESLAPLVERAAEEHAAVEAELTEAQRIVEEATGRLVDIERHLASLATPDGDGYGAVDVAAIVTGLTPMIDPPGPDPIPVLMVETFLPLGSLATHALEATMAAAVRVQLVYATDDPLVIEWAEQLSPSAGRLIRLGRTNWFQRRLARRRSRTEQQPG